MRICTFGLNLVIHFGFSFLSRESWHFPGSSGFVGIWTQGICSLKVTLGLMAGGIGKGSAQSPWAWCVEGCGVGVGRRWKTSVKRKKNGDLCKPQNFFKFILGPHIRYQAIISDAGHLEIAIAMPLLKSTIQYKRITLLAFVNRTLHLERVGAVRPQASKQCFQS